MYYLFLLFFIKSFLWILLLLFAWITSALTARIRHLLKLRSDGFSLQNVVIKIIHKMEKRIILKIWMKMFLWIEITNFSLDILLWFTSSKSLVSHSWRIIVFAAFTNIYRFSGIGIRFIVRVKRKQYFAHYFELVSTT